MTSEKIYDTVIIGAGPAGLTAALYLRRFNKTVLVLEKGTFGGQATYSPKIENYPGFKQISGNELADSMVEQVLEQGADIELECVTGVDNDGEYKRVTTDCGFYLAKTVIIAAGVRHRMLGLPGENDLVGNGISFCAVCDGAFYKSKEVAVIGGGNSALQEAILLSEQCSRVYIVQNLSFLTGEAKLASLIESRENCEILLGYTVKSLLSSSGSLTGIEIHNETDGSDKTLVVDGMFVAIGLIPENDVFKNLTHLDGSGYIVSDESCITDSDGIFVAGDCRTKRVRQISTAAADGAVAAVNANSYIDSHEF